jgi:UDPglucose--hexose-1-phosphate uridylyltransferase
MPELRKDPIIKRWVIIATERARRPHDFINSKEKAEPPSVHSITAMNTRLHRKSWPSDRPIPRRIALAVGSGSTEQDSRPRSRGGTERFGHGMYDVIKGFGGHEVIVETPDHNATLATLSYQQVKEIIWAYKERFRSLEKTRGSNTFDL